MKSKSLEEVENQRKRLIFRSGHRGTKEMDLLLGGFAAQNVPGFTPAQLDEYQGFLENNDPDLYNWISGQEEPPANIAALSFFDALKAFRHV